MVTITVFYKDGLKRGPPANSATFFKVTYEKLAESTTRTTIVPLQIVKQTGNRYQVESQSAPLSGNPPLTIRVRVPSNGNGAVGGEQEIGINDGDSTEVWI